MSLEIYPFTEYIPQIYDWEKKNKIREDGSRSPWKIILHGKSSLESPWKIFQKVLEKKCKKSIIMAYKNEKKS